MSERNGVAAGHAKRSAQQMSVSRPTPRWSISDPTRAIGSGQRVRRPNNIPGPPHWPHVGTAWRSLEKQRACSSSARCSTSEVNMGRVHQRGWHSSERWCSRRATSGVSGHLVVPGTLRPAIVRCRTAYVWAARVIVPVQWWFARS